MLEREFILPDGRKLSYAEYGRQDGHPVFYFHGSPSSRLEPLLYREEELARLGLRVIAPDRPGMGGSDFQAGRGFSHWPADVIVLAGVLRLEKFSVWGYSGGAPYVAVCAAEIPERIVAAVIVAGGWRMDWSEATVELPLPNRVMLFLARWAPWLLGWGLKSMTHLGQGDPAKELAQMKNRLPAPDFAWFAQDPGRFALFGRILREALRRGTRGGVWDLGLYVRSFDFPAGDVKRPVRWLHGRQDAFASLAMAHRAVADMPGARITITENAGHLSMSTDHLETVAAALLGQS